MQYKLQLAARFATGKIYADLLHIYKKYESGWSDDARGPLLSYLARINDRATRPLIEERLTKAGEKSGFNLFYNLSAAGPLSKEVEKLLAVRLESDDGQTAGAAAYYLSKNPSAENRKIIQKRYARWLKEWGARGAEIENPQSAPQVQSQARIQTELLSVLLRTKEWNLSADEAYQLRITCATAACRRDFYSRATSPPIK